MIRVRIGDERVRLYIYAYLQSFAGRDQMLRNEYGSVQQHLEPRHVSGILIPIPPLWQDLDAVIEPTRAAIQARELLEESVKSSSGQIHKLLGDLTAFNEEHS